MSVDGFGAYIPIDRRLAIARGETLPDRTRGAALFADISGFTPITETLTLTLGPRRSVEKLVENINAVYEALINEIDRYGGSVISFAGDAVTCWFDESLPHSSARAIGAAMAVQAAMKKVGAIAQIDGTRMPIAIKATVASGAARRFLVGDPEIQLVDALAGDVVERAATAEHLAKSGEVLIDSATKDTLGSAVQISEWRDDTPSHQRFAVVQSLPLIKSPTFSDKMAKPLSNDQVRPWLLKAIYSRHIAGQSEFLTELRPVVALFASFGGIEYDEDDSAGAKLDSFIRWVQRVLERFEGTFLGLTIGDKGSYVNAAFGAPRAHEDDAQRSIYAAMRLQQIPTDLNFIRALRIGISQGTMCVGEYGSPTRRTYGILGNEVNLAARLMTRATPGELLLSGRIQKNVSEEFDLEPLPPIELKGKAEPLLPFLVKGSKRDRHLGLQEPRQTLPMIGRAKQLALVEEKLTLALQGKGQIIGITAEAGMGKSRLVAEVIQLAKRRGLRRYGGACQSYGTDTSYLVWTPIWRSFFSIDDTAPLRRQLRNLEGEIQDLAPQRAEALPLLSALLQIPISENDFTRTLEPEYRKSSLEALLLDCVHAAAKEAGAEGKALLFVLEDLHWIDPVARDLLEAFASTIADSPVLVVLAYRPNQIGQVAPTISRVEDLPYFTRIALMELNAIEAEALIRAKLSQFAPERMEAIPKALINQITAQAEGNPFYLEEFLNYLRDRGLDPFDAASLTTLELPNSLQRLILSRIDQLTEQQALTLKVASIIGRLFKFTDLHRYYVALGEPEQVRENLDELERLDLTPLDTPDPDLTYLFKHIVTHEVAYESLPNATRSMLHERYARYLELQISTSSIPELHQLDLLAHHFDKSDNLIKKREYLWRAAEAAQSSFANSSALNYYQRLLPLLDDPIECIAVQLKTGAVLELTGRWSDAETHYRGALVLAEQTQDTAAQAQCQQALGILDRQRGEYGAALRWLEQAEERWMSLDEQTSLNRVLTEKGDVFLRLGDLAAASKNLQKSMALARKRGDKTGMAQALRLLGVASHQSDYAAAHSLHLESLALWRELGNKPGISSTLNGLAILAAEKGDYSSARTLYEESLALRRELGDKRGIAILLNNLGTLVEEQGDYVAAQTLYAESLALERELGAKSSIATTLGNLGVVAVEQGDYVKARGLYLESLTLWRDIGSKHGIGNLMLRQGMLAHAEGNPEGAIVLISEGLAQFQGTEEKLYIARCLAALMIIAVDQAMKTHDNALAKRAARLAGTTDALTSSLKTPLDRQFRLPYERAMALLKTLMDQDAFAAAWESGKQLTLEDAVSFELTKSF